MKIRIRIPGRMSLEGVLFFVALFCVVSFALLENVSISIPAFYMVKMPLIYLGGVCILLHILPLIKVLKKKKYFYVMMVLFLFFCFLALTVHFYKEFEGPGSSPRGKTERLVFYLLELFFLMIWAVESGRSQYVLNFLFYYVLILTAASDLLMFTGLIEFGSGGEIAYLVGLKFSVAYFHINLLTLWFIRSKQRLYTDRRAKRILIVGIPFLMWVSIYVDCVTGFLGSIILLVMFALLNTKARKRIIKLNSPLMLLAALTASVAFPFIAEQIMSIPFVLNLVTNIIGRSENLTGRINIFSSFIAQMEGHWLWGYGYGNANTAAMQLFGYANAQNALLQWVLQVGIPTTAILVFLMLLIFWQLTRSQAVGRSMPLVILIYLYIILGMVEITFSMSFLLWVGLVFMLVCDNQDLDIAENKRVGKG